MNAAALGSPPSTLCQVQLSGRESVSFDDFLATFETTPAGVTLQLGDGSSFSFAGLAAWQLAPDDFLWA